jgi:hypothetical protein
MSAFGVDHGLVSKSFRKLSPKLYGLKGPEYDSQNLDQRIRHNYMMFRGTAGNNASYYKGKKKSKDFKGAKNVARTYKKWAQAQVDAAGARSKRKGRTLP